MIITKPLFKNNLPNYKGWYLSESLNSASKQGVDSFLPVFALGIGATAVQIGLLASLFYFISISQIAWAKISSKLHKSRTFVFFGNLISALLFIPLSILRAGEMIVLFAIRILQGFSDSIAAPNQTSLITDHASMNERSHKINAFTLARLIGIAVSSIIISFVFGFFSIYCYDERLTFVIIFLWIASLGILGTFIFFVSVPEIKQIHDDIQPFEVNSDHKISSFQFTHPITKNRFPNISNIWIYCLFIALFYFGIYIASPFLIVFGVVNFGFTVVEVGLLATVSVFSQLFTVYFLYRYNVIDFFKRKHLIFIGASLLGLPAVMILIPFYSHEIPAFLWVAILWIIMSMGGGIFNVSILVFLLEIIDPKRKTTLIAKYNISVSLMMFAGPIIAVIILELTQNMALLFFLRIVFVLCAFPFLFFVNESRIPNKRGPLIMRYLGRKNLFVFSRRSKFTLKKLSL